MDFINSYSPEPPTYPLSLDFFDFRVGSEKFPKIHRSKRLRLCISLSDPKDDQEVSRKLSAIAILPFKG